MRYFLLLLTSILLATGLFAQNPALNMTELANWDVDTLPTVGGAMFQYNDVWGYTACDGTEYALLGSEGAVHFIEVTPADSLIERDFYQPGEVTLWRDMKVYHDRAFSVCDNCDEGLVMYDLAPLPDSVRVLEQNRESFGAAHNLYVDEPNHRLYVVGANDPDANLLIYDLENIGDTLPDPVRLQLPGGYIHDINVTDHIAYASHGTLGLYIYDLSQLDTFTLLGQLEDYPQMGYNHSSWPSENGDYLVMADETHNTSLKLVNISDPQDPQVTDLFRSKLLAPVDTATIVHNPFVLGDYIIASYYHDGVSVFDWSDPTDVRQVAYYDTEPDNTGYGSFTGNWGVYPYLPSQRILASDMHHGLFVLRTDSITFAPSPLLLAAPTPDTLGRPVLCADEEVSFTLTTALPPHAALNWTVDGQSVIADTLRIDSAAVIYGVATQRHCRYPLDSIVVRQVIFPDTLLPGPASLAFCPQESLTLAAVDTDFDYTWTLDGVVLATNTPVLTITQPGTYTLQLTGGGCSSSTTLRTVELYEVLPLPITSSGDTLLATTPGLTGYQWYRDGEAIVGATAAIYAIDSLAQTARFTVTATDANGCMAASDELQILVSTVAIPEADLRVYPNPARTELYVELPTDGTWTLRLTDVLGRSRQQRTTGRRVRLEVGHLAAGSYLLQAANETTARVLNVRVIKH